MRDSSIPVFVDQSLSKDLTINFMAAATMTIKEANLLENKICEAIYYFKGKNKRADKDSIHNELIKL